MHRGVIEDVVGFGPREYVKGYYVRAISEIEGMQGR
jgi:hypothetical protein